MASIVQDDLDLNFVEDMCAFTGCDPDDHLADVVQVSSHATAYQPHELVLALRARV